MAQSARLVAGAALQLGIAEGLLGAELGGENIGLLHRVTGLAGQGQKGLKIHGIGVVVKPDRQLRAAIPPSKPDLHQAPAAESFPLLPTRVKGMTRATSVSS